MSAPDISGGSRPVGGWLDATSGAARRGPQRRPALREPRRPGRRQRCRSRGRGRAGGTARVRAAGGTAPRGGDSCRRPRPRQRGLRCGLEVGGSQHVASQNALVEPGRVALHVGFDALDSSRSLRCPGAHVARARRPARCVYRPARAKDPRGSAGRAASPGAPVSRAAPRRGDRGQHLRLSSVQRVLGISSF